MSTSSTVTEGYADVWLITMLLRCKLTSRHPLHRKHERHNIKWVSGKQAGEQVLILVLSANCSLLSKRLPTFLMCIVCYSLDPRREGCQVGGEGLALFARVVHPSIFTQYRVTAQHLADLSRQLHQIHGKSDLKVGLKFTSSTRTPQLGGR